MDRRGKPLRRLIVGFGRTAFFFFSGWHCGAVEPGVVANQRPSLAESAPSRAQTRKSRETALPCNVEIILFTLY